MVARRTASPLGYAWPSLRVAEPEEFCLADVLQFGLPLRLIPKSRTGSRCFINLVVGGDRRLPCLEVENIPKMIVSKSSAIISAYNPELGPLCYSLWKESSFPTAFSLHYAYSAFLPTSPEARGQGLFECGAHSREMYLSLGIMRTYFLWWYCRNTTLVLML